MLVEDVEVICSWWKMPFVKGKMEAAHRDICKKVIEKVEMLKRQEAVAKTAAKGKGRAVEPLDPDEEEPQERYPEKITYG